MFSVLVSRATGSEIQGFQGISLVSCFIDLDCGLVRISSCQGFVALLMDPQIPKPLQTLLLCQLLSGCLPLGELWNLLNPQTQSVITYVRDAALASSTHYFHHKVFPNYLTLLNMSNILKCSII